MHLLFVWKIWTEYTERNPSDENVGNVNFLPGMGAFLQSIIYGFAGFRIRPDKLDIHNPIPPPGANQIRLINFYYLGSNMTFTITAEKTTIEVIKINPKYELILRRNVSGAREESMTAGNIVILLYLFTYWLARLQALSDPYYQSTCLCVGNFDDKYLWKLSDLGVCVQLKTL